MAPQHDLPWAHCDHHCLPGAVSLACPLHNRHPVAAPPAVALAVERVEALEVRPGDTIIVTPNPDVRLTLKMQDELAQALSAMWPGHRVLVAAGFSLGVVRPDGATEGTTGAEDDDPQVTP
jgi:hypothetical protein